MPLDNGHELHKSGRNIDAAEEFNSSDFWSANHARSSTASGLPSSQFTGDHIIFGPQPEMHLAYIPRDNPDTHDLNSRIADEAIRNVGQPVPDKGGLDADSVSSGIAKLFEKVGASEFSNVHGEYAFLNTLHSPYWSEHSGYYQPGDVVVSKHPAHDGKFLERTPANYAVIGNDGKLYGYSAGADGNAKWGPVKFDSISSVYRRR